MEKVHYYKVTRRGGRSYSPWRANTALCYTITRRGEWVVSKHCSLSRIARGGEQTTRGGERNRFSVGKCDFSPQKPNFHPTQSQI